MSLRSFLDAVGAPNHAIAVVSDEATEPLEGMLADAFAESSIDVVAEDAGGGSDDAGDADPGSAIAMGSEDAADADRERERNRDRDRNRNVAVLLENGEPVASSSLSELYESVLAINSDLFTTGARGLGEIELPDVLATLADTRLRLRGYPLAHKEKLLLILVSRYIEQAAWETVGGTIRSSFQRLSRLDDEVGTREVYARLADAAVDVHVYGMPAAAGDGGGSAAAGAGTDAETEDGAADAFPIDLDVTVHTGTTDEYRNGWFVVHRPPEPTAADATPAALVCLETEPRIWDGYWTFDPERVVAIDDYVATEL